MCSCILVAPVLRASQLCRLIEQNDKHISKLMQDCYEHLERKRQVLRSDVIIANIWHFPNRKMLRVWVKLEGASSLNANSGHEVCCILQHVSHDHEQTLTARDARMQVRQAIKQGLERSNALRARAEALARTGALATELERQGRGARQLLLV